MKTFRLNFRGARENLLWILLVGLGLGLATYGMGGWPTLGQSMVQQVIISLVIGGGAFVIVDSLLPWGAVWGARLHYLVMALSFVVLGMVGTEVEGLVRRFLFGETDFLWGVWRGGHWFNAILTVILGFSTFRLTQLRAAAASHSEPPASEAPREPAPVTAELQQVPIRQGEAIRLFPIEAILYLEAYDNYAFLHDEAGNKYLCSYSLRKLEEKLGDSFLRVHRKYLINTQQILQVQPHLKGRFVIEFKDRRRTKITSSSSYTEAIKALIRL
ncbi:MAG: LytTR family DNA-binding domain-containing protein [Bacteroidota bacterium]